MENENKYTLEDILEYVTANFDEAFDTYMEYENAVIIIASKHSFAGIGGDYTPFFVLKSDCRPRYGVFPDLMSHYLTMDELKEEEYRPTVKFR